jgi:hypothetical protein
MKIPIPVGGCAAGAPSVSGSGNQSKMDATTFAPSYLHLTAKLKVRVEEMKIIGVDVEAEIVDIETNNLLVALVQDVMKSKGHSFSVSLSPGALNSADGSISNGKSAWTQNFGNIIGRSALTIIAQDTIALAGGMIANAERDSGGHSSMADGSDPLDAIYKNILPYVELLDVEGNLALMIGGMCLLLPKVTALLCSSLSICSF